MIPEYPPDAWLPLSGIQHFIFCRRQWALIHVERQWQESALTADGQILHKRVDDPFFTEKRKDVIVTRSLPVFSATLGLSGVCDVVEFTASAQGVQLAGRDGCFLPAPVEYKRGKVKTDGSDEIQLCAQAICLEEMLAIPIPVGYLYYGTTRRRVAVTLGDELRERVRKAAQEMHAYFERGYTPKVKPFKGCKSCSLIDVCMPQVQAETTQASTYIRQQIEKA